MTTADRRLVVVTGTPRSGTTPVGDMLGAAPGAATLYEPLNYHVGDQRVTRYFELVDRGGFSAQTCDAITDDVLRLRPRLQRGVFPEDGGLRRAVKWVVGSQTRQSLRKARRTRRLTTLVWKDPFAVFLAEHISRRHDAPVVVTVRPPAAVAASFKRLGWSFDVADLVHRLGAQGDRYEHLLDVDLLKQPWYNGASLWHVVNDWALAAHERLPSVHILDMDRVVVDRTVTMHAVYDRTGLRWTASAERYVNNAGRGEGPTRPTGTRAHGGTRNVAAVNSYWRDVLSVDEAATVERMNADLWERVRVTSV
jgi:hypothetical protein